MFDSRGAHQVYPCRVAVLSPSSTKLLGLSRINAVQHTAAATAADSGSALTVAFGQRFGSLAPGIAVLAETQTPAGSLNLLVDSLG